MTALDDRRAPAGTDPDGPWWTRAACQGAPTELFFPNARRAATEAATYCQRCPVLAACDQDAHRQRRTTGIFGGRYWEDGKPHTIQPPAPPRPAAAKPPKPAAPNRLQRAANRRRDALGRLRMIRHQHPSDRAAWAQIAREYGVNPNTVRDWERDAQHEAAAAQATRENR